MRFCAILTVEAALGFLVESNGYALQHVKDQTEAVWPESRPAWARGLKQFPCFWSRSRLVAPRVGAWIET